MLSGDPGAVGTVAALWSGSAVHPQPAGDEVGQASAAKAAFALYGKGRQALALLARQLAAQAGVADVLSAQGFRPGAELLADDGLEQSLDAVAWRWGPEFDELAATAQGARRRPRRGARVARGLAAARGRRRGADLDTTVTTGRHAR